jgi:hypothetical protein
MATIFWIILISASVFYVYQRTSRSSPLKSLPRNQNVELIKVLLSLEGQPLNELFRLYSDEFGQSAARYARQTYQKWKAGEVRPNRQTFNRLLINLPKIMSFDLKCEILRKLKEAYCSKDSYQLTVYTDDWKDKLTPLINGIIDRSYTAELPKPIAERLRWLSENEMHVAGAILAESQAEESRNAAAQLQQEIFNIERLLADVKGKKKITQTLKFPYGIITLKIKRR